MSRSTSGTRGDRERSPPLDRDRPIVPSRQGKEADGSGGLDSRERPKALERAIGEQRSSCIQWLPFALFSGKHAMSTEEANHDQSAAETDPVAFDVFAPCALDCRGSPLRVGSVV